MAEDWDPFGDTVGCAPRTYRWVLTDGMTFRPSLSWYEEQESGSDVDEPMTPEDHSRNVIPSPDLATLAGDSSLVHDVLIKPERQIRLLSRCPNNAWQLKTYSIENAPTYAAISYEWGEPDDPRQLIRIDERCLSVTPNCALALKQIWRHTQYDNFWIDAVCIDQTHHTEKGHQVQAMADIYRRAKCTLVSLGAHDVNSLRLYDALCSLEQPESVDTFPTLNPTAADPHSGPSSAFEERRWFADAIYGPRLVPGLDLQAAEKLLIAVSKFGRRDYWHRLWVYQELVLSNELLVLCGRDAIAWKHLVRLLGEFWQCFDKGREYGDTFCEHSDWRLRLIWRGRIRTGYTTLMSIHDRRSVSKGSSTEQPDLYQLLETTQERNCLDRRDKVFGIMRLVEWPPDVDVLPVNYQDPPIKIAIDVLQHYASYSYNAVRSAATLIKCLKITGTETAQFQQQLDSARIVSLSTTIVEIKRSTYLHGTPGGHLRGNFSMPDYGSMLSTLSSKQTTLPSSAHYRRLIGRYDRIVGIVSAECRPGDFLVELSDDMHVVFRPHGMYTFEFVGHAVLKPDVRVDWHSKSRDWLGEEPGRQKESAYHSDSDSDTDQSFGGEHVRSTLPLLVPPDEPIETRLHEWDEAIREGQSTTTSEQESNELREMREGYETAVHELQLQVFNDPEAKARELSNLRESYVDQLVALLAAEDQKGSAMRHRQLEYEVQIDAYELLLWSSNRRNKGVDTYVNSCNVSALQRCQAQTTFGARAMHVEKLVEGLNVAGGMVESRRMLEQYGDCSMRASGASSGVSGGSISGDISASPALDETHEFGKAPLRMLGKDSLISTSVAKDIAPCREDHSFVKCEGAVSSRRTGSDSARGQLLGPPATSKSVRILTTDHWTRDQILSSRAGMNLY